MSPALQLLIVFDSEPKDAWSKLKKRFEATNDKLNQIEILEDEIDTMKISEFENVFELTTRLEYLYGNLEILGVKHGELSKVRGLSKALKSNEEYDNVRRQIRNESNITFEKAVQ